MDIQYDVWLITISLLVSCLAMFVTFYFIEHLYRLPVSTKRPFFITYTIAVGSGLWAIHLINILAFHQPAHFSIINLAMALSWLSAIVAGYYICDVASKKLMPINTLISGATLIGAASYSMFYFGMMSVSASDTILLLPTLTPINLVSLIIAFAVVVGVSAISVTGLSWLKNYAGENKALIKLILSAVTAISIMATHIAFNATIDNGILANVNLLLGDKKMLGIIMALSMACVFLVVFVIALFYEKHGASTFNYRLLNKSENIDVTTLQYKDVLTHLPNRRGFNHSLKTAVKKCERGNITFALAYIDLDHFKPVNDNYGHRIGDAVLLAVAQRLNTAVRGCDVVARIGGDEFVAIIDEIKDNEDITPIIDRIVNAISEPFFVETHKIEISCSVGVALYPTDGEFEQLLICADAAMYKAKENGKNQFKFYDAAIELASNQMLKMQRDLRQAIKEKQFRLVFQPKFDCKTQAPIGAEALVRWVHPIKGVILPNDFIAAAERFGLMTQINEWVIEESCQALSRAKKANINLGLSINLTQQQLRNPNLVTDIIAQTSQYTTPKSQLTFEIKETAMKDEALFNNLLGQFKAANMRVALDDFGSHPFTLSYLQNLNINEIKLDKHFVANMTDDKTSWKLVDILISLAHTLNLNVVAEGVETDAQKTALTQLGCNHMQGYLLSKPLSEEKLFNLLKNYYISIDSADKLSAGDYQEFAA